LKQRYLDGDPIHTVRISMASTADDVAKVLNEKPCDMIYIDSQHGPHAEWDVKRICMAAEERGVGVQLRIKHTRHTYLLGNYLDLGPLCIKVPEVEERAVVEEAIESFYFPPVGRRSWGGQCGFWCGGL
jgi:2-keto-3-deoxy-L-rhamnonate aldolase RhmA